MTDFYDGDRLDERTGYFGKRAFDLTAALLLFLPAVLVSAICCLVIWLECRCNPIFAQRRVGRNGRTFTLIKLRTMAPETGDLPTHETEQASLLAVGKVMRSTKLDELPQVWNVLVGDMSFVGPRPCLTSQQVLIEERRERGVLRLRPGITGPSQIIGLDMSRPVELARSDAAYLDSASMLEDIRLVALTLLGRGSGDRIRSR